MEHTNVLCMHRIAGSARYAQCTHGLPRAGSAARVCTNVLSGVNVAYYVWLWVSIQDTTYSHSVDVCENVMPLQSVSWCPFMCLFMQTTANEDFKETLSRCCCCRIFAALHHLCNSRARSSKPQFTLAFLWYA